jgi:hypothetical protein
MATTFKMLGRATINSTTGASAIYTVPGATKTQIAKIVLAVQTTGNAKGLVTVYHAPSGGAAAVGNIVYGKEMASSGLTAASFTNGLVDGPTVEILEGIIMETGDKLFGITAVALGDVTITAYGIEIS